MGGFVPAPKLDDRSFDDLLREARQRAVRYLPDWSDHNASDPGTTLLELFAWFTEVMLYRFNQIPELHRRKFCELLGLGLRPPRPSEVQLEFTPAGSSAAAVPAGTRVGAVAADDSGQVFFETLDDVELVPHPLVAVRVFDGERYRDHTRDQESGGGSFAPFGEHGERGSAVYLGFEPPKRQQPVSFPSRIRLFVRRPREAGHRRDEPTTTRFTPAPDADLVWEYATARSSQPWVELRSLNDDTAGFLRDGAIHIAGPPNEGADAIVPTLQAEVVDELLWLRCRVARGCYPARCAPEVSRIQHNTVRAGQWLTVLDEELDVGTGRPDQTVPLLNAPVLTDSLRLITEEKSGDSIEWTRVDDLQARRADEHVFELEPTTGAVRFGDGKHGAPPSDGARIVAARYRFGGGARGNVRAESATQVLESVQGVAKVTNPDPAFGGKDGETVEELVARAPSEVRRRSRAVTPEDFESLVVDEVGGVAIARAMPLVHPMYPGVEVPGAVTVVVVPDWDFAVRRERPVLTPAMRDLVCARLDMRRLVGTELCVVGPVFAEVVVHGIVSVDSHYAFPEVEREVEAAITRFLMPVESSTGRIDSSGPQWQLGPMLRPALLLATMLRVEGVVNVSGFGVDLDGQPIDSEAVESLPPRAMLWDSERHCLKLEWADESESRRDR